ncbi:30S ribosomal protein S27e [Methanocalculus sp.]|jgi:small subunit ribosomal protein S27e|uniref:30S ribosomal protein S27e n=1 Tax=Methanocalculus sp. TaxID=2004547 RepID=UPI00260FD831|nr:30S ribosomal protein S27e [Methanocalculus sp.]MDG6251317.1 30S ribosomal protein S27e [Methanocalculus sp.]
MVELNRENRSSFVKVKCPDCENEQVIFEKASTVVDCIVCGTVLAETTGGKALIKAEIVSQFE